VDAGGNTALFPQILEIDIELVVVFCTLTGFYGHFGKLLRLKEPGGLLSFKIGLDILGRS
jgi:hypothetical protein